MAGDIRQLEAHYAQRRALLDAEYHQQARMFEEAEKEREHRTRYLRKEFVAEEQRLTERLAWLESRVDAAEVVDIAEWWAIADSLCPSATKGSSNEFSDY